MSRTNCGRDVVDDDRLALQVTHPDGGLLLSVRGDKNAWIQARNPMEVGR